MHHAKVARDPPNMVTTQLQKVNGVLPFGGSHFGREFIFIRIELFIVRSIFGSHGYKKLAVLPCSGGDWLFFIEIFVVFYFNTCGESGYQNPPWWSNG
jgi:hypothetical protein